MFIVTLSLKYLSRKVFIKLFCYRCGRHEEIKMTEKTKVSAEEMQAMELIFKLQDNGIMENLKKVRVSKPVKDCCQKILDNHAGNVITICVDTRNYYDSWMTERKHRITGSTCYRLFTYSYNKQANWKVKTEELISQKDFKSQYAEYGKKTENEARTVFTNIYCNLSVVETGLIVSLLNPWIGYSPDGVIFKNGVPTAVLEIKCPFTGKTKNTNETVMSIVGKSLYIDGNQIKLKKKHQYYGQVQLGMAVINVKHCMFVIYSSF